MQRFILATLLAILAATPSFASWSGCHMSAGVARETTVQTTEISGIAIDLGAKGTSAVAGLGCDYQFDRLVVGGIARYALGVDEGAVANGQLRWKAERQWMAAARAGYLVTDNLLAYVLAGMHGVNQSIADGSGMALSAHPTGFIGGLGLEARLTQHVSLRLEGDWSTSNSSFNDGFTDLTLKPETQTIRAEIVWHFVSLK